ncbi:MAG: tRNA (adenosine(37)-N6)-dimethylallyltransferase MiaA [Bacteroidales bacterium]|nr:tRNA (adenosine(37)-N6)-dimethylallyltransferase MiaA [Bacteroidales bacterium]
MTERIVTDYDILAVTGPTASGKTLLAAVIASRIGGEVISADSRQVYRKMNLGTGKDYSDYVVEGRSIPYHLIDIVNPGTRYNVFEYQRDFISAYNDLIKRGVFPVVCGGSGLYIDSIITGYRMYEVPPDPILRSALDKKSIAELTAILATYKKLHNKTDLDSKKRLIRAIEIEHFQSSRKKQVSRFPALKVLVTAIRLDRESRRRRISQRLKQRLAGGMIDEVKKLLTEGISSETLIYYGLEYKYITLYLMGRLSYEEMTGELETAIHQYAKRQMTWFRGMEKKGTVIHWIDGELPIERKAEQIIGLL